MTAIPAIPVPAPVSIPELAGPPVWPASAVARPGGDIAVAGVPLTEPAERYGTPVRVVDEEEVRAGARAWRRALPDADVVYAAEAFLCRAVVDWMAEEGLGLAVRSADELELAAARGFPADRIVLHGTAKSPRDLRTALRLGVGRIVIDSPCEIARIASQVPGPEPQQVLIRVRPGAGAEGEFGLSVAGGEAEDAVARVLGQPCLELVGLHSDPGSRVTSVSPEPHARAVRRLVALLTRIRDRFGITLPELDLGGGFATARLPGEPAPPPAAYARRIQDELLRACAATDLPVPRITVEPGRSLMAPAGVTLHRVLAIGRTPGGRTLVAVDGGPGEGPGPAPSVRMIGRVSSAPMRTATVVGRHGGPGDVLAEGVELPEDVRPGDLLAVPGSGAYGAATAPGCPAASRPPVVAVRAGRARLLVRRETYEDVRARDIGL
ncbi:diaminopimelate decarboxylase family protein [Streptomyces qinzhouensis]|uniref:Diaminopimelate decarboxylase n=1 Tax=Streptomyces qinzhouensis TaxID=2599401 RepID=A0A5B8IQ15_9ACTN|nr:diaminopimelate decarboxylase [Streptomyces qinzhouensis]QDY79699.1 diaminopimelate decarboxylase [Streptomyces qinzhouensis]